MPPVRIFISYRRSDSRDVTERIHEHLIRAFRARNVFKDVNDIPAGTNFKTTLQTEVAQANVLLVVIGPQWLNARDERGKRRLNNAGDFVRIEIETGLNAAHVRVIPVLVSDAKMPRENELPASMRELHFRHAARVRHDPDFEADMKALIRDIRTPATSSVKPKVPFRVLFAVLLCIMLLVAFVTDINLQPHPIPAQPAETATSTNAEVALPASLTPETTPTLTLEPTATPSATAAPEGTTQQLTVSSPNSEAAFIRGGPGTSFNVRGQVQNGEIIEVLGEDANGFWLNVRAQSGVIGWMYVGLLLTATPNSAD
jgi:hypothetical protein